MKQAFVALEHLVVKYLPDHLKVSLRLPDHQVQRARDAVDEACSVFLDELSDTVLNSADDKRGALQLQYYQRRVIRLTDRLAPFYDEHAALDISIRKERVLHAVADSLVNLLAEMRADFGQYFDLDLPMPYVQKVMFQYRINEKWRQVAAMLEASDITDELPAILEDWIRVCTASRGCASRHADYIERLLDAIIDSATPNRRQLHDLMALHNMNHPPFVEYLCNRITRKLQNLRDDHTRGKMVRVISSRIEMARYGEKMAADEASPSLKQQLLQWLQIQSFEYDSLSVGNEPAETGKIRFGLTGLELGCLLQIAISANVIKSTNKKRDIDIASRVFATIGQEEMSSESLYTAFYNLKPSAMESVKDKLLTMVNLLIKRIAEAKRPVK